MSVKASVLHGAKDLRVEERPLSTPGPGEVQVAVRATGLCGSDLHYFGHFRNGDILVREPLTLGHESAGEVVAVGPNDTNDLKVGDKVALEVGQPCGECNLCTTGRYNICREMRFRSSAKSFPHAQGTLQEVVVHPARWCHKLPEKVSLDLAALSEPLSVAVHAWGRSRIAPHEALGATVLVFGAGAVGLLCAAVAKVSGVKRVIIADIQADRLDFAVKNGFADASVLVPIKRPETVEEKLVFAKSVAELVKEKGREGGDKIGEVSATFECTGVESCMQASIFATQPGGKIMIIGMGNPIQTLPISAASLREVDLVGVFRYANTYPAVISLLSEANPKLPPLEKLITHRFKGMDNIPSAFEMAAKVKDETGNLVIKVMVDM